ncbi:SDR family NAD(P)-dependent oxidoreductase [Flavobacterium enshiense]|uniref:SDR family oxidoreductase n=1 Tax=Flavobacterium enshiense TaxID=1341165 RepID=UPI00345DC450
MKTTNNTILITGGGSGIGYEMAKLFSENNNTVIITGRNEKRLQEAVSKLNNVHYIVSDVTNENEIDSLVEKVKSEYPNLNILINNAGRAILHDLTQENANAFESALDEISTNYLSVIRLTEKLLPVLSKKDEAAVVNISSVAALVASHKLSTYSASKAALHSYTQSLRHFLKDSKIKVFEVMPPLVNTEFSKEIGGEKGIHPNVVANDLFNGLSNNRFEIHVGDTAAIYQLSLTSPKEAYDLMNN